LQFFGFFKRKKFICGVTLKSPFDCLFKNKRLEKFVKTVQ